MTSPVAQTIRNQIGHRALYMLGAKNFTFSDDSLEFKIMRNAMKVSHIRITLDRGTDSYTMRFFHVGRAPGYVVSERAQFEGVYVDMLHNLIEEHTGLYTSL